MPKLNTWELVELTVKHAHRILLYGPPGTGKTHVAKTSGLTGERVLSITLHEDSTAAELEGFYRPKGDVFEWMDGHAVNAWRFGHRLVLNEIDRAQGEVLTFLYGILDDPELAEMTIGSGETIRPSGQFKCVATMNGVPSHLPDALIDRFDAIIPINEVNPSVYSAMPEPLAKLAKSKDVREKILGGAPSTRPMLAFGRLRRGMGDGPAAQVVFGKHADSILDALRVLEADKELAKEAVEKISG
jgi:MoxR-like ATPase